ncbi:PASTA domain-containing protein [Actinomadura roseirufa]|uniref:PASTA domain-containing protein n=1 Tax=Actinomadura roseirufa TaxID=2094049 RepID=UPI00104110EF|nr:PASTA domain-containing protein [Actinomadura roseirufa]
MRTTTIAAAGLLVASALAACGPVDQAGAAKPVKTVTVAPTTAPRAAGTTKHTAAAAEPTPKLIRVPRVVGHNHQAAQNEMQAAGLFMLHEKDATGQGRLLLWDRNWVVVRQSPAAGKRVGPDTPITLYSKKIGE